MPQDGGLDPDVGVDLEYFVDGRGFAKETAHMPGAGPTWLDGLIVLEDKGGRQRMLARYVKIAKPMKVYILIGQSNMQGHGHQSTLSYIKEDTKTKPLYSKIIDQNGKDKVYKDVPIIY